MDFVQLKYKCYTTNFHLSAHFQRKFNFHLSYFFGIPPHLRLNESQISNHYSCRLSAPKSQRFDRNFSKELWCMKLTCRVCQDLLPLKVLMPESFLGFPVTASYFPCNISSSYFSNFGFSVIFFQLRLMPLFTNGLHWQQCRNTINKKILPTCQQIYFWYSFHNIYCNWFKALSTAMRQYLSA